MIKLIAVDIDGTLLNDLMIKAKFCRRRFKLFNRQLQPGKRSCCVPAGRFVA